MGKGGKKSGSSGKASKLTPTWRKGESDRPVRSPIISNWVYDRESGPRGLYDFGSVEEILESRVPMRGRKFSSDRLPRSIAKEDRKEGLGRTHPLQSLLTRNALSNLYGSGAGGGQSWVRGYQEGGIASLMEPPMAPPMEPPIPQGPVAGEMDFEEGVEEVSEGGDEFIAVFSEARDALEGNHPDPNAALERFVEIFGIDALEKLKMMVESEESDGMSDSIPGNIGGEEEVALSEGEFVVPADAVSGMGNGSTDAGARRLMDMVDSVRTGRTGTTDQAPPIDPTQMGLGGLIRGCILLNCITIELDI